MSDLARMSSDLSCTVNFLLKLNNVRVGLLPMLVDVDNAVFYVHH